MFLLFLFSKDPSKFGFDTSKPGSINLGCKSGGGEGQPISEGTQMTCWGNTSLLPHEVNFISAAGQYRGFSNLRKCPRSSFLGFLTPIKKASTHFR